MRLLYSIMICLYVFTIKFVSVTNRKAELWIRGRKNWEQKLKQALSGNIKPVVWVHCSSLGEFEQGRPIIEMLKTQNSDIFLLLTFFSPSGFEVRKNYSHADYVCYLPADTQRNARMFVSLTLPVVALFIKYEFWYNYINALNINKTPIWLISGIFRSNQHFFKPWGHWFRKQLGKFDHFYVQNWQSEQLLNQIGIDRVTVGGDTRFDRVVEVASGGKEIVYAKQFTNNDFTIIGGSTWSPDEDLIIEYINRSDNNFKYIIAPHEINEGHIAQIRDRIAKKTILYSEITADTDMSDTKVLIIDNIGMLSMLYRYANIAIIGGGFGKGIHNILEPSVFGIPVIIGPNYKKFNEAIDLIALKTVFSVSNYHEFYSILNGLSNDSEALKTISELQSHYIESKRGTTPIVVSKIQTLLSQQDNINRQTI